MPSAWTEREVIHLLNRAAFGASNLEIKACLSYGKKETVRRLVSGIPLTEPSDALIDISQLKADNKELDGDLLADQQLYWLYRMIHTSTPLIEKMTLFWHSHFTTSISKVHLMPLMVRQNNLFRKHALGSFRDLLQAVSIDPAMMIWLDAGFNRKGSPNENYAREVMELFTLGRGHYTEQDVKEVARSLTGWGYDRNTDFVSFDRQQHDEGVKQVLGKKSNLNTASVIDVLLSQKEFYSFLARKLLQAFVHAAPSQAWIDRTSSKLAKSLNIGDLLSDIFLSDEFYEESIFMSIIKSPVEYVATISKLLSLPLSRYMMNATRAMGHDLYNPPNVSGWQGHEAWLMTTYQLVRFQFAEWAASQTTNKWFVPSTPTLFEKLSMEDKIKIWSKQLNISTLSKATCHGLTTYAEENLLQKEPDPRLILQLLMMCPESQLK
ncbi:DUF1800 domain-containing protein [Paenibacillus sp. SYP-B3998]|uniref:DUF1800 domain-containing protein n=1 Tax=Paenibacillus sp. SYP-B3998 TaxID=2678564 RepID=A0A6G3ZY69_9BACL|nr:DUF1800 domain-containing protein [Paenibacillus sp. SYP-B3998]NEW07166.1 DUF1800 domain-containing protein [Paenibacillus sp. SYP-B3998]